MPYSLLRLVMCSRARVCVSLPSRGEGRGKGAGPGSALPCLELLVGVWAALCAIRKAQAARMDGQWADANPRAKEVRWGAFKEGRGRCGRPG